MLICSYYINNATNTLIILTLYWERTKKYTKTIPITCEHASYSDSIHNQHTPPPPVKRKTKLPLRPWGSVLFLGSLLLSLWGSLWLSSSPSGSGALCWGPHFLFTHFLITGGGCVPPLREGLRRLSLPPMDKINASHTLDTYTRLYSTLCIEC